MYNRICIIGGPGTGKTTLSNKLSKIYNIPVTHIDGIHHLANWQPRDKNERDQIILSLIIVIIDHNFIVPGHPIRNIKISDITLKYSFIVTVIGISIIIGVKLTSTLQMTLVILI